MADLSDAQWTVVGVSLTAVFTAGTFWVTMRSHLLDTATTGLKRSLRFRAAPKSTIPTKDTFEFPDDWESGRDSCFLFELHNLAPYPVEAKIHVEKLRLGPLQRKIRAEAASSAQLETDGTSDEDFEDQFTLETNRPIPVWVILHGYESRDISKPVRRRVRFTIHSSHRDVKFNKRVWVQPISGIYPK